MDWDAVYFALTAAGLAIGAVALAAALFVGRLDSILLLGTAAGLAPLACWLADRVARSANGALRHPVAQPSRQHHGRRPPI